MRPVMGPSQEHCRYWLLAIMRRWKDRGRIAVFPDHGQEKDEEALRFPASFLGRNVCASFLGTRTNGREVLRWAREVGLAKQVPCM